MPRRRALAKPAGATGTTGQGACSRPRGSGMLWSAASAALAIGVWYAAALILQYGRGVHLPTPTQTALRLVRMLGGATVLDHTIYRHVADSVSRWGVGFTVAAVGGVAVGLAAGCRRGVHRVVMPVVHVLQLIPGLAWIPVALLLFGVGERATVFMIAVTAFTPIAVNVASGVRFVDTNYVRAAQMLGAPGWRILTAVLLPGAFPSVLSGLRTGLGNGWRVLVAGEMVVGTGTGLGYAIIQARWTLDYTAAFACLAIICGIGLILEHGIFGPLERRAASRWGTA